MSVLIKDMEMPKNCHNCELLTRIGVTYGAVYACQILNEVIGNVMVRQIRCPLVEIVHCKDCRWGREVCGNIECSVDMNVPVEYHGYDWYCPNGERRADGRAD